MHVVGQLAGSTRVAIWAEPTLDTAVGVIGALLAGVTVVPLNPGIGSLELDHILNESQPDAILCGRATTLPARLGECVRRDVDARGAGAARRDISSLPLPPLPPLPLPASPAQDAPAFVIYTSGTTGMPKGAVLSYRAVAANLDGLAQVWQWTARDRLVHALPLFHVHGLVLGTLGAVRVGSPLVHTGRFSPDAIASALNPAGNADTAPNGGVPNGGDAGTTGARTNAGLQHDGGTMLFGVPTMYHRLAKAAETEPAVAEALKRARVLVSGSAPLAAQDRETIERLTGQRVIERYGLTETLIVCAMPAGDRRIGVGPPVPGVEVRLVDDAGEVIATAGEVAAGRTDAAAARADGGAAAIVPSDEHGRDVAVADANANVDDNDSAGAFGEIELRGPSVFSGYLHRPDATARAFHDGWFRTGDTAIRDASGNFRIVGRTALDVIKTGGFKVGAGEVEDALRLHPHVAEVAVTGEPDADLGQRIVAWIVAQVDCTPNPVELEAHVASTLSSHKRPRIVHVLDALPRNAMGKIEKRKLTPALRAATPQ